MSRNERDYKTLGQQVDSYNGIHVGDRVTRIGPSVEGLPTYYETDVLWLYRAHKEVKLVIRDQYNKLRPFCSMESWESIHKVKAKEISMSNKNVNYVDDRNVNYIGGEYKVAKVRYVEGHQQAYNFKVDITMELELNALVVVEASNGLGLGYVVEVFENCVENADEIALAKAWVVNVVDTTMQDKRKDATRKRAYIIQQLDEKKSQMEAISVYALLAKTDPEAAKLMDQLTQLGQ